MEGEPADSCNRNINFAVDEIAEASIPLGIDGYKARVAPFFEKNCIGCHGPEKSKGKITLHTMDGDLAEGQEIERWELILDMLESGKMPPEDESQPAAEDRQAVVSWIEGGLRDHLAKANQESIAPTARRLTNFEYGNTMRDLFGFKPRMNPQAAPAGQSRRTQPRGDLQ